MAIWQERGYVPDSDDEEEDFPQLPLALATSDLDRKATESTDLVRQHDGFTASTNITSSQNGSALAIGSPKSTAEQLEETLTQGLLTVRDILNKSPSPSQLLLDDDSPLSSLPSSAASSPRLQTGGSLALTPVPVLTSDRPSVHQHHEDGAEYIIRRALRTRAPIQLHPYLLENVQYIESMKARGVKPVHAPRGSIPPNPEASGEDSQDTEVFHSSQAGETQSFDLPSSPTAEPQIDDESQSPLRGTRMQINTELNQINDELPELSQILKDRSNPKKRGFKAKNRAPLSHFGNGQARVAKNNRDISMHQDDAHILYLPDTFRVPPSPPFSDNIDPSDRAEVMYDSDIVMNTDTPSALPTPLLSSEQGTGKRARVILSDSDDSSSDTDVGDKSVILTGPEDTRPAISRLGRRIRGVLPASWLKLDMKAQTRPADSQRNVPPHSGNMPDKGVAQKSRRKSNLAMTQRLALEFSSEEDQESDDSEAVTPFDNSVIEVSSSTEDIDELPQGEALEENIVDAMIPSTGIRRRRADREQDQPWRSLDGHWSGVVSAKGHASPISSARPKPKPKSYSRIHDLKSSKRRKNSKRRLESPPVSVFDAPDLISTQKKVQPQFLRLAARQARRISPNVGLPATKKVFCFETSTASHEVYKDLDEFCAVPHSSEPSALNIVARASSNEGTSVDQAVNETLSSTAQLPPPAASHSLDDMTVLRASTNSLLKRISSRKKTIKSHRAENDHYIETAATPTHSARVQHLQSLFSRISNRSGEGRLVPTIAEFRTTRAKIVELDRPEQSQVHRPRQKVPRKATSNERLAASGLPALKVSSAGKPSGKKETSTNRDNPPTKPGIVRKPRKQAPRKWNVYSPSTPAVNQHTLEIPGEMQFVTPADLARAGEALRQAQREPGFVYRVPEVNKQMKSTWTFGLHTRFQSRIIHSGALSQMIARYQDAAFYLGGSNPSTTILRMPGLNFSMSVGNFTEEAALGLQECHASMVQILDTRQYERNPRSAGDCIDGLESIIEWVNESISFHHPHPPIPPTTSLRGISLSSLDSVSEVFEAGSNLRQQPHTGFSSSRHRFLDMSMDFVRNVAEHIQTAVFDETNLNYTFLVQLQNWLTAHAFQLHTVARVTGEYENEAKDLCHEMMLAALKGISHYVQLLRSHYLMAAIDRDHIISNVPYSFDERLPSANTVLITWHLSRAMANNSSASYFYELLGQSVVLRDPENAVDDACTVLSAVAYVIRFQDLDARGALVMHNKQHFSAGEAGWSLLIPFVSRLIIHLRDMVFYPIGMNQYSRHVFVKGVVRFLMELTFEWQWTPTPNSVWPLLQIYSINSMLPYDDTGDDVSIFYNHGLIDQVPTSERNDYDIFIDLVRMALALQQSMQTHEEGSRPAITASKLRGLVYSLLPNNVLVHDARSILRAEEFLGLKNNFALYLALYKGVPEGSGPRLEVLSRQVDLTRSHEMVSKLAIKVCEIVTRHEIARFTPGSTVFKEIGRWMSSMLLQIENRAENGAQDYHSLYEALFRMVCVCLTDSPSEEVAHDMFESTSTILKRLLSRDRVLDLNIGYNGVLEALKAIQAYLETTLNTENEGTLTWDMQELVSRYMIRISHDSVIPPDELINTVTSTWFCVARSLVRSFHKTWEDYLSPHSTLSLTFIADGENQTVFRVSQEYLITKIVEVENDVMFLEYRPLVLATWVAALVLPMHMNQTGNLLTSQISQYGAESMNLKEAFSRIKADAKNGDIMSLDLSNARLIILRHLFESMYGQQDNPESEWLAGGLDENDMRMLLSTITATMKNTWIRFSNKPVMQNEYTPFIEAVISEMEIYPFKGFKLDGWFTDGTGFPRRSQALESIFRCRFGEEGGEIEKSTIITFRLQMVQALRLSRQNNLTQDLIRGFHCTNSLRVRHDPSGKPSYSTDLIKQTQFLHAVFPVYIEQASSQEGATAVRPILDCLTFITQNIFFRIDNLEPGRMASFIVAVVSCLAAVRSALRAQARLTQATPALLKYARVAIEVIWSLLSREEIEVEEEVHEAFTVNVMGLVVAASEQSSDSVEEEVEAMAVGFFARFWAKRELPLGEKEEELRRFAAEDWKGAVSGLKLEGVEVLGFEREKVEEEARELIALIAKLPLFPDEEE